MSACEMAYDSSSKALVKFKNVAKVEEKHEKNAKERLLFCKCTC